MKKMASLIIAVMTVTLVSWAWGEEAEVKSENKFENEIRAFEAWDAKNAWPKDAVLFAGSSSIRMWNSREWFSNLPVINRGFGGAQICDMLYFMDRVVLKYKPSVIVFYCGDNDVACNKKAERVLADFQEFVGQVRAELPETKIIYLTIKPSGARWNLWLEMARANDLIQKYCGQNEMLYFADGASCLLGADGKPNDEYFKEDKLHLSQKGYERWTEVVRPVLDKALAKDKH